MSDRTPPGADPSSGDGRPTLYRVSPSLAARFVGLALVVWALVMFAATALVSVLDLAPALLVVLLAVGVVGVLALGWALRSRWYVVRCDGHGYRVRLVRGAGVTAASWRDVEDAVTASPGGIPCVVLRLRDGRTTTIPVQVLAVDREQFVRELRGHLQRGQGLRPL